jgi:hypothetical protein
LKQLALAVAAALAAPALALPALVAPALVGSAAAQDSEEAIYNQIEEVHGDAAGFLQLASDLSDAVGKGQHRRFARLLTYPITVSANGEEYDIADAADFERDFETLVQSELQTDLVDWTLADTVVTSEGVGILGGNLWFANVCANEGCAATEWVVTRIAND